MKTPLQNHPYRFSNLNVDWFSENISVYVIYVNVFSMSKFKTEKGRVMEIWFWWKLFWNTVERMKGKQLFAE